MSSLGQRMRWRPGDPSPALDLEDVLVMLHVDGLPEDEQRQAVDAALDKGAIGAPSVAALRAAGWIETTVPRRSFARRVPWPVVDAVLLSMALPLAIWGLWNDELSLALRIVATSLLIFVLPGLLVRIELRDRQTSRR